MYTGKPEGSTIVRKELNHGLVLGDEFLLQALPNLAILMNDFNNDVKNQVLEEKMMVSDLDKAMEMDEQDVNLDLNPGTDSDSDGVGEEVGKQEDQDRRSDGSGSTVDDDNVDDLNTIDSDSSGSSSQASRVCNNSSKNEIEIESKDMQEKGLIGFIEEFITKFNEENAAEAKRANGCIGQSISSGKAESKGIKVNYKKKMLKSKKSEMSFKKVLFSRKKNGNATRVTEAPSPSTGTTEADISAEASIFSHTKTNKKHLAWYHANLGGWASKRHVLNNIVSSSEFDCLALTETHTSSNKMILKGFKFFSRSRSIKTKSKGGVALGIRDGLAEHAVKVYEGEGSNEVIMVKLTCFKPAVIFGVVYGNQEGTTPAEVIRENIKSTLMAAEKFSSQGLKVILVGDFNLHVGLAVEGNDEKVSRGGEYLLDLCDELGFVIANDMAEIQSHTHFDRSSKTSRVLDLVLTNDSENIEVLNIDVEKTVTPYRLTTNWLGEAERKYTDHLAIFGETKVSVKTKKREDKVKIWDLKKKGAKALFQFLTNQKAGIARKIVINAKNCTEMLEQIEALLLIAKKEAFDLKTVTTKRMERETDERLALKRVRELQELADEMNDFRLRTADKVFLARKKLIKEQEEMNEALDHYKTGERMEEPSDIFNSVMDYNVEVLTKNECANEWARERMEEKKAAVRFFEQVETEETEKDIQWDEWEKVITKITELNKACYRDLVWAGHEWQAAMYMMFKRIFREEDVPQKFLETKLKKLYKKKGDKTKLSSYRFIHLKQWAAKVMEKLAMQKCNDLIAGVMPEGQIGGMKKSSTSEHISSLHALARMKMKEKSGIIIMFVDVKKCFDKQRLDDTMYSAAIAGVKGRGLRMIRKLHDNTVISLIGDPTARKETIVNSTGQGTNWAPLACSLSMGKAFKAADDQFPEGKMQIDGLKIPLLQFVDDTNKTCETSEQARIGGKVFTQALNELGLEAHPDKSAMVIMGGKKYREKIMKELEEDPVYVQGFKMQVSECETYLGVEMSEKGPRDSVTKSIRKRIRAAMGKEVQLSKMLESEQMDKAGWMDAVRTLANSIISPTITYAAQSYAFLTKTQVAEIEGAFKEILYRMLGVSKYTQYAAVLLECNMIKIKHIINQLKIGFIKDLIHSKGTGPCLDIHRKEEELYPGTGLIAEVKKLCEEYSLPDATIENIDKELIRDKIWEIGRIEIWKDTVRNKRVPFNRTHIKTHKNYMSMGRYLSKLFFAFRVGELQFKEYRRGEFNKRFGNTKCFMDGCDSPDNLEHVRTCDKYPEDLRFPDDNFNYDPNEQREFIKYLQKLDVYRGKQFDLPLLYRPSLKKQIERKLKEGSL